jgi:hypothetical protein
MILIPHPGRRVTTYGFRFVARGRFYKRAGFARATLARAAEDTLRRELAETAFRRAGRGPGPYSAFPGMYPRPRAPAWVMLLPTHPDERRPRCAPCPSS